MKLAREGTTNHQETTVARSRGCSPLDGQFPFGEVDGAKKGHERPGLDGWPGRFWLPANRQVQPTGKSCLSRAFGRAGAPSGMVSNPAPRAECRAVPAQLPSRVENATLAP